MALYMRAYDLSRKLYCVLDVFPHDPQLEHSQYHYKDPISIECQENVAKGYVLVPKEGLEIFSGKIKYP